MWAYLNVSNPLVAWLIYRGHMLSTERVQRATPSSSPLSMFHAARLKASAGRTAVYKTELAIEAVRARRYPDQVSRLTGFYVFVDEADARRAESVWDGSFRSEYLNEVALADGSRTSVYDSTWIVEEFATGAGDWIGEYLSGRPHDSGPLWETLVDGNAYVLGTELRERAHETVAMVWPRTLELLELGRIAAELDSHLGLISAFAVPVDEVIEVRYAIDLRDAANPDFLAHVSQFVENLDNAVNRAELEPISETDWFAVPDLQSQHFETSG